MIETFVDWFAGIGGIALGLEPLGLKCVGACENDRFARQTYEKNFGHKPEFIDARFIDPGQVPDHDLFCAGFPCQAFSTAGKWEGFRGAEGSLFFDACSVLAAKRPSYLLLENVRSILKVGYIDEGKNAVPGTDGWVFLQILATLDGLGYDIQWQVLNSRDFGVPQSRERVYIIGNLRSVPRPEVFPFSDDAREVAVDRKRRSIRPLSTLRPGMKTGRQSGRIWAPDRVAPTVTTAPEILSPESRYGSDGGCLDGGDLRKLTPVECERLQGFPDGWTEGVSDTQRQKQIGNAVTVKAIRAIGARLVKEVNE